MSSLGFDGSSIREEPQIGSVTKHPVSPKASHLLKKALLLELLDELVRGRPGGVQALLERRHVDHRSLVQVVESLRGMRSHIANEATMPLPHLNDGRCRSRRFLCCVSDPTEEELQPPLPVSVEAHGHEAVVVLRPPAPEGSAAIAIFPYLSISAWKSLA